MSEVIAFQPSISDFNIIHTRSRPVDATHPSFAGGMDPSKTCAQNRTALLAAGVYLFEQGGGKLIIPGNVIYDILGVINWFDMNDLIIEFPDGGSLRQCAGVDDGIFLFRRCNGVQVRYGNFIGNNISANDGTSGSALYVDNVGSNPGDVFEGFYFDEVTMTDFRGAGWLRIQCIEDGYLSDIRMTKIKASGGSDRAPTDIGVASAQIAIKLASQGTIRDWTIEYPVLNASNVKMGIEVQDTAGNATTHGSIINGQVIQPRVINAGQLNYNPNPLLNVKGAYAMAFYGFAVERFQVLKPDITDPVTCGIYCNSSRNYSILGGRIAGQLDTVDDTLPRGALVMAQCQGAFAGDGLVIEDSAIAATIQPYSAATTVKHSGTIADIIGNNNATGIKIRPHGTDPGYGISILRTHMWGTYAGSCIETWFGDVGSGSKLHHVTIEDNDGSATLYGAGYGAVGYYDGLYLNRNHWNAPQSVHILAGAIGDIDNYTFIGNTSVGSVIAFLLQLWGPRGIIADNSIADVGTADDATTGAWQLPGTRGSMWNNPVRNLAVGASHVIPTGAEDLGADPPTWTADPGTKIEVAQPASGGRMGWVWVTGEAWKTWGPID